MPEVFGGWSHPGGKRAPFAYEDSQLLKYSRKYKYGKRVGRREVVEKFKALSIDHERAYKLTTLCPLCAWLEDDSSEYDDDWDEDEFWDWDCEVPCQYFGKLNVKGVYTINREAFLIHARAVGHEVKDSDSHLRRHRTSKQKRCEAKKNGRQALRDFEALE